MFGIPIPIRRGIFKRVSIVTPYHLQAAPTTSPDWEDQRGSLIVTLIFRCDALFATPPNVAHRMESSVEFQRRLCPTRLTRAMSVLSPLRGREPNNVSTRGVLVTGDNMAKMHH